MLMFSLCFVSLAEPQFTKPVEDATRFLVSAAAHAHREAEEPLASRVMMISAARIIRGMFFLHVHVGIQIPGACGDFGSQTFSVLMGRF